MEILEAVHALHDVHLRDKCERAITAVQRTIDLYGCVLPEDSIPGGFEASATLLELYTDERDVLQGLKLGFQLQWRQRLHRLIAYITSSMC